MATYAISVSPSGTQLLTFTSASIGAVTQTLYTVPANKYLKIINGYITVTHTGNSAGPFRVRVKTAASGGASIYNVMDFTPGSALAGTYSSDLFNNAASVTGLTTALAQDTIIGPGDVIDCTIYNQGGATRTTTITVSVLEFE